jgi:hypothetical protein
MKTSEKGVTRGDERKQEPLGLIDFLEPTGSRAEGIFPFVEPLRSVSTKRPKSGMEQLGSNRLLNQMPPKCSLLLYIDI